LAHLEYFCTNNQAEYEAIFLGVQILSSCGVKHVEAFGDSLLVVHQVADVFQCFDRSLNAYIDKCLEISTLIDDFIVQHVSMDENTVVNNLAQQALGFRSNRGKLVFWKKLDLLVCQTGQSSFCLMCSAIICSTKPHSAKPNGPASEIGGSKIYRILDESYELTMAHPDDWKTPLVHYLENAGHIADSKV
jgi:hypothetical protein